METDASEQTATL